MHWNGDDLNGTVEVLGTPAGNILKELFKSGIKLGISSRGLGSVKEMNEDDSKETKHIFYTCLSLFSLVVVWQIFVYSPFIS